MAEIRRSSRHTPYTTNKRARQACENCRYVRTERLPSPQTSATDTSASRKKSKCTGERPDCSCCVRLRQRCVYATQYRTRERSIGPHDVPHMAGTNDVMHANHISLCYAHPSLVQASRHDSRSAEETCRHD
ncbi:hypothetical protein IG631_16790 [Alternaria alternata]|nr:hypothetical protein IG631_16790 [Alternaria alternata]